MPDQQATPNGRGSDRSMGRSVVASAFGNELRRLRRKAGLSLRQFAQLVHYDAGHLSKIENGLRLPSPDLARTCDVHLGADGHLSVLGPAERSADPRLIDPHTSSSEAEDLIGDAAGTALAFSLATQATSREVVGLLYDEVRTLAQEYPRRPLTQLLTRMVQVQDLAFQVLGDRARPADARQLYFLAGITCGMVAKASHDLAQPRAAMIQTRTAFVCAEQAGHRGLMAWVRGLQALIAYWAGRPAESVRHAEDGNGLSQNSTAIWLPISESRGWAALGHAESAFSAIRRAEDAADLVRPDDLDELGGMCFCGPTRAQFYAADAFTWMPEHAKTAERYAEQAVEAYADQSSAEWSIGNQAASHAAMSAARVIQGEIDGAAEALAPALTLAPEHRITGVISSVLRVGHAVRRSNLGQDAAELTEQIESFVRAPAVALQP